MKTFQFTGNYEDDAVPEMIVQLDDVISTGESIRLYLNSTGGSLLDMYLLDDYLKTYADQIELVGHGYVASAAFLTLWLFPGKKRVLPYTFGMIHQGSIHLCSRELQNSASFHSMQQETWMAENEHWYNTFKSFLSAKERKDFQKGQEINFAPDRMKLLFPN